jgi:hypothetical protein
VKEVRAYFGIALGIGLTALAVFASADLARAACDGGSMQFSDDFSHPHPSWSPFGAEAFGNNKYIMVVEPNAVMSDWPSAVRFSESYRVCVKIMLPTDPNGAAGSGLLFWIDPQKNGLGGRNYYMAMLSPDGFYWISRTFNGVRSDIIDPVQSDVVKTGPNVVNEIEVILRDNRGALMINGRQVGSFSGEPPSQSHAGILAGAPVDKRYRIEFSDFRVVKP